jgi:hypothetical protein
MSTLGWLVESLSSPSIGGDSSSKAFKRTLGRFGVK